MYLLNWAVYVQFAIFFLFTVLYYFSIEHAWKLGKWLQEQLPPADNQP